MRSELIALSILIGTATSGCNKKPTYDDAPLPSATSAETAVAPVAAAPKRRAIPPKPPEHLNPTPEALARRARSVARLQSEGVPINATLPVIDTEAEAKPRTKDAAVDRAIALMIVAVKGEGLEQEAVLKSRDKYGAVKFFSPEETVFIAKLEPTPGDKAKFGWRYEDLGVMLWALGFDAALPRPNHIVDAGRIVKVVSDRGPTKFRDEAKLRSTKELLDAADLIYRYDWACTDAREGRKPAPHDVDCEVVVERHWALNWLIGYQSQEWDDVSTDT